MPDNPAPPETGSDRRSAPRSLPLLDVAVHCRLVAAGPNAALGLVDVSAGGCRLRLAEPVEPGRVLALAFRADARRAVVRVAGLVAWSRPDAGGSYAAGVAFDRRLRDDEMAALADRGPGPLTRPLADAKALGSDGGNSFPGR